jgi:precorrin-6B methylase 1
VKFEKVLEMAEKGEYEKMLEALAKEGPVVTRADFRALVFAVERAERAVVQRDPEIAERAIAEIVKSAGRGTDVVYTLVERLRKIAEDLRRGNIDAARERAEALKLAAEATVAYGYRI